MNRRARRSLRALALCVVALAASAASAEEWPYAEWEHRLEITPYGAYQWTGARASDFREFSGTFDLKSSGAWGVTVDVNVSPGVQAELLYQRQDTKLTFREEKSDPESGVFDVALDAIQLGAVAGSQFGKAFPFTKFTMGATHFNPKGGEAKSTWRFAVTLGLGAKLYLHERIGVRAELQLPWTYLSGETKIFCDENGCLSPVGGTGLAQLNLALGVMFLLGG
jgi:opacity protein-like surface antigen